MIGDLSLEQIQLSFLSSNTPLYTIRKRNNDDTFVYSWKKISLFFYPGITTGVMFIR